MNVLINQANLAQFGIILLCLSHFPTFRMKQKKCIWSVLPVLFVYSPAWLLQYCYKNERLKSTSLCKQALLPLVKHGAAEFLSPPVTMQLFRAVHAHGKQLETYLWKELSDRPAPKLWIAGWESGDAPAQMRVSLHWGDTAEMVVSL